MVRDSDMHPVANRQEYQAEAPGSQDPSSMSAHNTGYERHGGYKDVVHEPTSTQAQGKSGKGNGYDYGAAIHKSSPTEVKDHQSHISSTVYVTGCDQHSGYQDPVQKPPPTGNQTHVSSSGYGTGYDRVRGDKDPAQKPPPAEVQGLSQSYASSSGYNNAYDRDNRYQDPVIKPPPTEGTENQSIVSSSGYGTADDRFGGNVYPVHRQSLTEAMRKHSHLSSSSQGTEHPQQRITVDVPKTMIDTFPLGPGTSHDQVSGHKDPNNLHKRDENSSDLSVTGVVPERPNPSQITVNLQIGQDGTFRVNSLPASPRASTLDLASPSTDLPTSKSIPTGICCCSIL